MAVDGNVCSPNGATHRLHYLYLLIVPDTEQFQQPATVFNCIGQAALTIPIPRRHRDLSLISSKLLTMVFQPCSDP